MTAETLAAEKAALRRLMRKRRAALAPEARAAASLGAGKRLVAALRPPAAQGNGIDTTALAQGLDELAERIETIAVRLETHHIA